MNMLSIPGAPGWFETLLNMSLQATLLTGVVWIVLKIFGRWIPPNWRALLWFVVIARVLIPFAPASAFSLQNLFTRETPVAARGVVERVPSEPSVFDADSFAAPTITEAQVTPFAQEAPTKPARRAVNWARIASGIWVVTGGLLIGLLIVRSLVIWYRLIRYGSRPTPFILGLISDCRSQLRLRYPLRATVSDRIAAPALTGLVPARLIIPSAFGEARFNVRQLRQILLHELAHVQQGHLLLHWLALIARALHWFNPAIHFAAIRLRQECELAADAAALQNSSAEDRAAYGETILQILAESAAPPTLLALGMAEQARHLQHRLRALTRTQRCFTSLGVVCAILLAGTGLTGASSPSVDSTKSATRLAAPTDKIPVLSDIPILGRLFRSDSTSSSIEIAQGSSKSANSESPKQSTNSAPINPGRKRLLDKLATIRIDDFPLPSDVDLVEVLKELNAEVRKRDPDGRGINLIISQGAERGPDATPAVDVERFRIKFDPPLRDVTLGHFFEALVRVAMPPEGAPASARLKYSIEDYAIIFSEDTDRPNMSAIQNRAANVSSARGQPAELAPSAVARQQIIQKLESIRIDDFPLTSPVDLIEVLNELRSETRKLDPEHQGVNFVIDKSQRQAANGDIDLEKFKIKINPPIRNVTLGQLCDVMIRVGAPPQGASKGARLTFSVTDYGVVFSLREDGDRTRPEQPAAKPGASSEAESPVNPNPSDTKSVVHTSPGRQALYRKLDTIRIDLFPLPSEVDLREVLKELGSEVRKRDQDGRGVNFILTSPNQNSDIDPGSFQIKFDPAIRDVTLGQFLDAIVMVAKPPQTAQTPARLQYSVEDYAIVFSVRSATTAQDVSRTYRLNPNTFRQGLDGVAVNNSPQNNLAVPKE